MNTVSEYYLRDLAPLILDRAREAKKAAQKSKDPFELGRQSAFYAVLSLMKQQAVAFGMDEQAIGLQGVDLERDFL